MSLMSRYRTTGPCGSLSHDANAMSKIQCKRQRKEKGVLATLDSAMGCSLWAMSYVVKGRAMDCGRNALAYLFFLHYKMRVMALVLYCLYIRHLYIPRRSIRPEILGLDKHPEKPRVRCCSCSGGISSWYFDLLSTSEAVYPRRCDWIVGRSHCRCGLRCRADSWGVFHEHRGSAGNSGWK